MCSALNSITVKAVNPPVVLDDMGVSPELPIYVPEGSVAEYKSADYWKYLNIIGGEASIDGIIVKNADKVAYKLLHDGKLIISKNGKIYNLHGMEMK